MGASLVVGHLVDVGEAPSSPVDVNQGIGHGKTYVSASLSRAWGAPTLRTRWAMGVIMIEMKEGADGVFRERGPDVPLPYGLPEDTQEPYVAIVAPNIDKISPVSFDRRTLAGRRALRGLIVVASTIVGAGVLVGIVVGVQWVLGLFGVEY